MSLYLNNIIPYKLATLTTKVSDTIILPLPEDCGKVYVQLFVEGYSSNPFRVKDVNDFIEVPTAYINDLTFSLTSDFFPEEGAKFQLVISYIDKKTKEMVEKYDMDLDTSIVRSMTVNYGTIVIELMSGEKFALNKSMLSGAISQGRPNKVSNGGSCGQTGWKPSKPKD